MWTPNASSRVLGQVSPHPTPPPLSTRVRAGSRRCGHGGFSIIGPRVLRGSNLGYEETSAQPDLTWSIMLSFLPNHLYADHTKEEHKGEQDGDEF